MWYGLAVYHDSNDFDLFSLQIKMGFHVRSVFSFRPNDQFA